MTKQEFIKERTEIISQMLDNPDENGNYPTAKCYEQLDALYDIIALDFKVKAVTLLSEKYINEWAEGAANGAVCKAMYEDEKNREDMIRLLTAVLKYAVSWYRSKLVDLF